MTGAALLRNGPLDCSDRAAVCAIDAWGWLGGPTGFDANGASTPGNHWLRGFPSCYADDAPQRAEGDLVSGVESRSLADDVLGNGPIQTLWVPPSGWSMLQAGGVVAP